MDKKVKDFNNVKNSSKNKPPVSVDSNEVELNGENSNKVELNGETEEDYETKTLLPSRRGGLSKKSGKKRLKVQWNDKDGNKLAEILEFQPSDVSDSDDEDSDSCMCAIM